MARIGQTIAAVATPPGQGGIGIVRVSGAASKTIATAITGIEPQPNQARFRVFVDADGTVIDRGIMLYFAAPHSYTGEDVVELQAHGGSIVLRMLLHRVIALGARPAAPGEFTERAFLNDKLDLAQAEAVSALISSQSEQAARSATRVLEGRLSEQIHALRRQLSRVRAYLEGALDFPEEEIDFLNDGRVEKDLRAWLQVLARVLQQVRDGTVLSKGLHIVIAGPPNAGKSSLLNRLTMSERAIVAAAPGTTRDILHDHIVLAGSAVKVIDTAGLRRTSDEVEAEGVRRALQAMAAADLVLLMLDAATDPQQQLAKIESQLPPSADIVLVCNKIDVAGLPAASGKIDRFPAIYVSVKTGAGMALLEQHLEQQVSAQLSCEDPLAASERQLQALQAAHDHVGDGLAGFVRQGAGELLAQDLREANARLGEIIGEYTSDDLLGEIFSRFCIGK